ncbi:MAG: MarR family winged helix-turn-helix transcriptional regulator [Candidatus Hodarchaeales archaeon]
MSSMKEQRTGGFLIAKIHQLGGRIFAKKLKQYQLTEINPAQGRILFPLWQKDEISIHELSKATLLGKSTLTTMLKRLEEEGHIKRIPSEKDRRKTLIKLTEKNQKLQEKYVQVSSEMNDLFYHGLTEQEKDEFDRYLERILENLTIYSTENK